jgi:hypothetical protein
MFVCARVLDMRLAGQVLAVSATASGIAAVSNAGELLLADMDALMEEVDHPVAQLLGAEEQVCASCVCEQHISATAVTAAATAKRG